MQPAGPPPARWRRTRASGPRTWQTRAAAARPATACSPSPRPRPARPARRRRRCRRRCRRPARRRRRRCRRAAAARPAARAAARPPARRRRAAGGRAQRQRRRPRAPRRCRLAACARVRGRARAQGVQSSAAEPRDVGDSRTDPRVWCSRSGRWHKALAHAPRCSNTKHHEQVWRPRTCTAAAQRLGARYPPPEQPAAGSGAHAAGNCRRAAAHAALQSSVVWSRRGPLD